MEIANDKYLSGWPPGNQFARHFLRSLSLLPRWYKSNAPSAKWKRCCHSEANIEYVRLLAARGVHEFNAAW